MSHRTSRSTSEGVNERGEAKLFEKRSRRETEHAQPSNWVRHGVLNSHESRSSDPKPDDPSLGRLKPDYNRVEDRNQF